MITKEKLTELGVADEAVQDKVISEVDTLLSTDKATTITEQEVIADKRVNKAFTDVDETINTHTGVTKNDNEKTSNYATRAIDDFLVTKTSDLTKDRDGWKGKFEGHEGDETLKDELSKATKQVDDFPEILQKKDEDWQGKLDDSVKELSNFKNEQGFTQAMPALDPNANQFEIQKRRADAIKEIQDGEFVFSFDGDGKFIATKDYQPRLVSDLLKGSEHLKPVLKKVSDGGGGGGPGDSKPGEKVTLTIPEGTTKADAQQLVRVHLKINENLDKTDAGYSERFKEICKESEIV